MHAQIEFRKDLIASTAEINFFISVFLNAFHKSSELEYRYSGSECACLRVDAFVFVCVYMSVEFCVVCDTSTFAYVCVCVWKHENAMCTTLFVKKCHQWYGVV